MARTWGGGRCTPNLDKQKIKIKLKGEKTNNSMSKF